MGKSHMNSGSVHTSGPPGCVHTDAHMWSCVFRSSVTRQTKRQLLVQQQWAAWMPRFGAEGVFFFFSLKEIVAHKRMSDSRTGWENVITHIARAFWNVLYWRILVHSIELGKQFLSWISCSDPVCTHPVTSPFSFATASSRCYPFFTQALCPHVMWALMILYVCIKSGIQKWEKTWFFFWVWHIWG